MIKAHQSPSTTKKNTTISHLFGHFVHIRTHNEKSIGFTTVQSIGFLSFYIKRVRTVVTVRLHCNHKSFRVEQLKADQNLFFKREKQLEIN